MNLNERAAARIARRVAVRNMVDANRYSFPKRYSEKAVDMMLKHPQVFSVPTKEEINNRRIRLGFPRMADQPAQNMVERQAPERMMVEDLDDLQVAETGTFDPSVYSSKFSYEVLHLLYYQLPQDQRQNQGAPRGTYLPFLQREPDMAWIRDKLEAFDGRDIVGLRTGFDAEQVMCILERPDQLAIQVVRERMPGLLNLPVEANIMNFLDDLGFMAAYLPRVRREAKRTIRETFKDLLVSLRQFTIAIEETDFNLTRVYTLIIDLREEISNMLDEYRVGRGGDAPALVTHLLRHQVDRVDQLIRQIASKRMQQIDLIGCRNDEFLSTTYPKVYVALKRALGCAEGAQTFLANGQERQAENFIRFGLNQNLMSLCLSSVLGDGDDTLKHMVENNIPNLEVIDSLGLVNAQGLAAYCQDLSDSLGVGLRRVNIFEYCMNLRIQDGVFQQTANHKLRHIIRCSFILRYSAIRN